MKIMLSNGVAVEGTAEQIKRIITALGLSDHIPATYESTTHGIMFIENMDTQHIRNALLKKVRAWVERLSKASDTDVLQALHSFALDTEFIDLKNEFSKRVNTKPTNGIYTSIDLKDIRNKLFI
jgi:hypothetical protein